MPKSQNDMNQQDTNLPFCKSVKFLYSGCKETLQFLFQSSKVELISKVVVLFVLEKHQHINGQINQSIFDLDVFWQHDKVEFAFFLAKILYFSAQR